jgi:SAM-dependent methyltransferase
LTDQTALQRLKLGLSLRYYRFIDVLHAPFVKPSRDDPYHQVFRRFTELGRGFEAPAVLEVGSRNVSGITRRDVFTHCSKYVGFDIHPGEGVDVVGDCHRLSRYLPAEEFDLVYTVSVFEHLMFPWKVVLELNKVMKSGGCIFVSTHPAWPTHELPWDFFRYMAGGFGALFNEFTGFELVEVSEGLPCRAYALVNDAPARAVSRNVINLGVAAIARKTGSYRDDLLRWDIDAADVSDSMYPRGGGQSARRRDLAGDIDLAGD